MATPLRALFVEDNPSDAELVLHALRRAGYDPIGARVETEKAYRDHLKPVPEIILADFSMPEFGAMRALEIMQECQLDIPFIVVSGSIGEERAVLIMQRGAADYIIKDRLGRLGQAVAHALEHNDLKHQFRQAQKMEAIGRLAGGVAHDFNNLLTVINGFSEMAMMRLPEGDPGREMLGQVVVAGDRAARLTRQLLAFSRKAIIEPKILDLKAVVADAEKMIQRIIGEDIQLSIVSDPELGAVNADVGQIEQVILNLVVNAADAMPKGGRLTIEVRNAVLDETYTRDHAEVQAGRYVLLAVSDTGCGIDQPTMTKIFEPFFTTKGDRGTGLGLATVHGIVKQSGGSVCAYSEVGLGTILKVYLPRMEQLPTACPPQQPLAVLPRGSETVLFVEDEDAVRALSRHVLQNAGYTVLEARDGEEALRVAGQHPGRIDLLTTDVVMPRMGGREVAEKLAATRPGSKVLFLSGYTDDAVVRHGILQAQVAFLQKPFSPASLVMKVRAVLDNKTEGKT